MIEALKALSLETKAMIIVTEFEAHRMPVFQLRTVLNVIVRDEADRKAVVDMVEKDLRATGYPDAEISAFLSDLLSTMGPPPPGDVIGVQSTRRLRSPFAMGFESGSAEAVPGSGSNPAVPSLAGSNFVPRGVVSGGGISGSVPSVPGDARSGSGTQTSIPRPGSLKERGNTAFMFDSGPRAATPAAAGTPAGPSGSGSRLTRPDLKPPGLPKPPPTANVRPTVLVADDDKRIRLVFRLRLEEAGFHVIEASDGNEAWEKLQTGKIQLVVLDMKMSGLHGLDILAKLVDAQNTLPVIVCSAYDQLENEFVVKTYPNLKYLVKPISPDILIGHVRELLAPKSS